jgi:hypothetical protein
MVDVLLGSVTPVEIPKAAEMQLQDRRDSSTHEALKGLHMA